MNTAVASVDAVNALPTGHRLHEFEVRGVIGAGGFGIVYRAFDHSLQRDVAIKEYMPSALAGRTSRQQVSLLSQSHAETFAVGLASFVNEARLLAQFDHPSLVKVLRFWEDNGTAYIAMPLYRGRTLRQWRLALAGPPDEVWLRKLMDHLLGALEVMHKDGVFHRDIAPDNILVDDGGVPVLLDFGAARRVISDRSQTLTAILKPSYAPLEQYAESTGLRQGPWTDFYALGATLHFLITGKPPMAATARALHDDQPRLAGSGQGGLSDVLLQVCDWLLALRPGDRPQHASEVRAALVARLPVPVAEAAPASDTAWQNTVTQQAEAPAVDVDVPLPTAPRRRSAMPVVVSLVVLLALLAAGAVVLWAWDGDPHEAAAAAIAPASPIPPGGVTGTALPVQGPTLQVAAPSQGSDAAPVASVPPEGTARAVMPSRKPVTAAAPRPPPRAAAVPRAAAPAFSDTPVEPPPTLVEGRSPTPPEGVGSPRDQCNGRHLIALHRCMVRECEKPGFRQHPQCEKVRVLEDRARRAATAN